MNTLIHSEKPLSMCESIRRVLLAPPGCCWRRAGAAGWSGPAEAVTGPVRAEPLSDLLGDLAVRQVRRETAGGRGAARGYGAVRDDHRAFKADQRGAAVGFRIDPLLQFAQRAAL